MDFLKLDYKQFSPLVTNLNLSEGDIIPVDKPYKVTSFEVVNKLKIAIKEHLRQQGLPHKFKIGHAGTLDPLATGLLVICIGKKTKQIEQIQALEKEYTGTFFIGATTSCFDRERPVDASYPTGHITEELIHQKTGEFTGTFLQYPPAFSAVKVNGVRAYDLARQGAEDIQVKPKEVTISTFEITRITLPEIDFKVVCSKGTYIRSLARDFGLALGSGAYLTALKRTRIGSYTLSHAVGTGII